MLASLYSTASNVVETNLPLILVIGLGITLVFFGYRLLKRILK